MAEHSSPVTGHRPTKLSRERNLKRYIHRKHVQHKCYCVPGHFYKLTDHFKQVTLGWHEHLSFGSNMFSSAKTNNFPRKQTSALPGSHSQETKQTSNPCPTIHLATVFPFTFLGCGHTATMYVKQNKNWAYEQSLMCQSSKTRKLSWHLQIRTFTTALCRDKTGDTSGNQSWLKYQSNPKAQPGVFPMSRDCVGRSVWECPQMPASF